MYFNTEDILTKEHETLCDVVFGEPNNDFVMGQVSGILQLTWNLLHKKEDGE